LIVIVLPVSEGECDAVLQPLNDGVVALLTPTLKLAGRKAPRRRWMVG